MQETLPSPLLAFSAARCHPLARFTLRNLISFWQLVCTDLVAVTSVLSRPSPDTPGSGGINDYGTNFPIGRLVMGIASFSHGQDDINLCLNTLPQAGQQMFRTLSSL